MNSVDDIESSEPAVRLFWGQWEEGVCSAASPPHRVQCAPGKLLVAASVGVRCAVSATRFRSVSTNGRPSKTCKCKKIEQLFYQQI